MVVFTDSSRTCTAIVVGIIDIQVIGIVLLSDATVLEADSPPAHISLALLGVGLSGGDLVRWVAHCAFGSIMRLHGNDHRPWGYDDGIENDIRNYLLARARLAPSLIAAGHRATRTAFPPVARADFYWPEYAPLSSTNTQYIFLDSVLVAPMDTLCEERSGSPDTETNGGRCDPAAGSVEPPSARVHGWGWKCGSATQCNTNASGGFSYSSRTVWIPPGQWHDAWNGSVIVGPQTVKVTMPYHQQPMWHKAGSIIILCDEPGLRVTEQNWSTLTLDLFPAPAAATSTSINGDRTPIETKRTLFERADASTSSNVDQTSLRLLSGGGDGTVSTVRLEINGSTPRAWNVRLNLLLGQRVVAGSMWLTTIDASSEFLSTEALPLDALRQIEPHRSRSEFARNESNTFFPFRGSGSPTAPGAGRAIEVVLPMSTRKQRGRVLELQVCGDATSDLQACG